MRKWNERNSDIVQAALDIEAIRQEVETTRRAVCTNDG
jgi:hypothetical protein